PKGTEAKDILSFHRSNDFEHIGNEVRKTRESVGVTETSNFAKYEVTGDGTEAFLNHLMTNTMPKTGRIVLTPMLNDNGKIIGDFTIAKRAEGSFLIWGSIAAQKYHIRWFEKHLPKDGSVAIRRFGINLVGLSIVGPNSRKVLQKLTDADCSNEAFKFMDIREIDVHGAPAIVNRLTYAGDLGYELWMEPAYQRKIYEGIKAAGAEFGIVDFGMRALLSMRLEKNFPTWFRELRPIYNAFEGGMERFVKLSKNDFIGRAAAAKQLEEGGGKLRRVSFVVDALDADVMGDEPIWARTSTDYGTVDKPHGYGAPRFDLSGKATPRNPDTGIERDGWRVVGWVTSGGYAHYVEKSMAQGYVPKELAGDGSEGLFEIEILGVRRKARINVEPLFDPTGGRMRG
ncbi:MAG: aminomethyltransferase family protein, partial [Rhizobiaceae bacterium]